jgi:hypothetical protein
MIDQPTDRLGQFGQRHRIRNENKFAATYRIEFATVACVEVTLPPGGEVHFATQVPEVNVNLYDFRTGIVQAVVRADD